MFSKILDNVQNNLLRWIAVALIGGLFFVRVFGGYAFTPLICLLAAVVMIYPSMVPLSFGRLKEALGRKKIILISIALNFVFAPTVAFFIGVIFLEQYPALWIGLMLLALLPGGGMATTWALKSKSDMPTAIGIIFANLLVAVLVVPFAVSFLMEKMMNVGSVSSETESCSVGSATGGVFSCASGDINPGKIAIAMVFIVLVPLVLAYVTQVVLKNYKGAEYFERTKGFFGKLSNLGLVLILLALMALESNEVLFSSPKMILVAFFPVALFYGLYYVLVSAVFSFLGKNAEAKSLVWGSYLRYITLALGISISLIYQKPDLSLATVPIIIAYFVQIPSSVLISKKFENIK